MPTLRKLSNIFIENQYIGERKYKKNISSFKHLIVIPILNGESKVYERLENISKHCSHNIFDICIISDGSTDKTVEIVKQWNSNNTFWKIHILQNRHNIGRALSHNRVVSELVDYNNFVFSDLDTSFTDTFPRLAIEKIVKDKSIGAISGRVSFPIKNIYSIPYFLFSQLEAYLRKLSSYAGLAMDGSGPCLVINRKAWINLAPYEDIDQIAGFMCLKNSMSFKYMFDSVCVDVANNSSRLDFKARSRMSRKALLSLRNQINYKYLKPTEIVSLALYIIHRHSRYITSPLALVFLYLLVINFTFSLGFAPLSVASLFFSSFAYISPNLYIWYCSHFWNNWIYY